jgi:hypothetical protein
MINHEVHEGHEVIKYFYFLNFVLLVAFVVQTDFVDWLRSNGEITYA